ncbi:ATP-binding protein [Streptomyces sp. NPDC048389]|uniref:ATP-binding protein n=1 Tax=Streptomyces sp. NPDC048389 TaxID=3154622 RepID=UPI0034554BF8
MNKEITRTGTPVRHFTVLLSATRRGARLARRLTVAHLVDWGRPYEAAEQIVAELAANAATHGRVPGRDFRLTLRLDAAGVVRIEVADSRGDRLPVRGRQCDDAVSGRGLLVVEALADRWGVDIGPVPRKSVWAEIDPFSPVAPEQGCRDSVFRDSAGREVKE